MRTFLAYVKIGISNQIRYKIASYAGIAVQFCWAVMNILLYRAFYLSGTNSDMTFSQVVSYMWLQQAFHSLFATWSLDGTILNSIMSGSVSYELCRPIKLYQSWYFQSVAKRIGKTLPKCFPILVIASLIPGDYGLKWEMEWYTVIAFLLAMLLSLALVSSFCMLIYIVVIHTISPLGIKMIMSSLVDFMSGAVIPLVFFPEWMQDFLKFSPFTYMQNIPLRIFSGNIQGTQIIFSLFMQMIWLFIMLSGGKLFMDRVLRKLVLFGG